MNNIDNKKNCEYCKKTFVIKSNKGSKQKFCCNKCKNEFHALGRKYMNFLLEQNKIDINTIKKQVLNHI